MRRWVSLEASELGLTEAEIAELAEESRAATDRIVDELESLFRSIQEEAGEAARTMEDEIAAIEEHIAELEAEGHEDLAAALRRLLERIEGMAPSESGRPNDAETSEGIQT